MTKVMLVEDDNNLREIYEARLAAEGYDIVTAKDGEEALEVAKQHRPELIISDVMMPRISGFEMLDILRTTNGLKDAKVIMLTALGQTEDKERANHLGADRYLVKSQVTLEDIVNAADELINGVEAPIDPSDVTPAAFAPEAAPAPSPEVPAPAAPATPAVAHTSEQPMVAMPTAPAPSPEVPAPAFPAAPAEPTTPVAPGTAALPGAAQIPAPIAPDTVIQPTMPPVEQTVEPPVDTTFAQVPAQPVVQPDPVAVQSVATPTSATVPDPAPATMPAATDQPLFQAVTTPAVDPTAAMPAPMPTPVASDPSVQALVDSTAAPSLEMPAPIEPTTVPQATTPEVAAPTQAPGGEIPVIELPDLDVQPEAAITADDTESKVQMPTNPDTDIVNDAQTAGDEEAAIEQQIEQFIHTESVMPEGITPQPTTEIEPVQASPADESANASLINSAVEQLVGEQDAAATEAPQVPTGDTPPTPPTDTAATPAPAPESTIQQVSGKKVIQPSTESSNKPDLATLVAQEESAANAAKGLTGNPVIADTTATPAPAVTPDAPAPGGVFTPNSDGNAQANAL